MKKIYLFLIILTIISVQNVKALGLCTPSDEYKEYMKLSEEEKNEYIEPVYCKEIIEKSSTTAEGVKDPYLFANSIVGKYFINDISASINDSRYNAYDDGIVTAPKNQYSTGMCWAFSAISVVETNALKNNYQAYDLSEAHLVYSIIGGDYLDNDGKINRYNHDDNGGKITYSPSYFFGKYGQLTESSMSFTSSITSDRKSLKKIMSNQYVAGSKMLSVKDYYLSNLGDNGACTTSEINDIKSRIVNYGSVQATMYMNTSLLSSDNEYYISTTNDATGPNHGVTIVGWDDTISKDNFEGATRDGAWIIKNSWGPTWSNDGLFYVSYQDDFICKQIGTYGGVSTKVYNNVYQSSEVVGLFKIALSDTIYMTTKFDKNTVAGQKEKLLRVSVPIGEDMIYYVYLSKDNDIESSDDWIYLGSKRSSQYGIESIDLSGIEIEDDFTIIVKYVIDSGKTTSVFTTCNSFDDQTNIEYNNDTNYIGSSLNAMMDMSALQFGSQNVKCEPNIYAYTDNIASTVPIDPLIPIDPPSEDYSVTVKPGSKLKIESTNIIATIGKNEKFTYGNLINGLTIGTSSYSVYNASGTKVTSSSATIGTNSELRVGNKTYKIVIVGDANGDGTVNSGDLLRIVKYLKKATTLTNSQLLAADSNRDNKVDSGDLLRIVKFLKGNANITV